MIPLQLQNSSERLAEVCRKFGIKELSLFGSQVRGDAKLQSDFDFLVEFDPDARIDFIKLGQIQSEFAEIVRGKVDVVPKKGLKAAIEAKVLAEAEILYAA